MSIKFAVKINLTKGLYDHCQSDDLDLLSGSQVKPPTRWEPRAVKGFPLYKPGVDQNIALHTASADRTFACLVFAIVFPSRPTRLFPKFL